MQKKKVKIRTQKFSDDTVNRTFNSLIILKLSLQCIADIDNIDCTLAPSKCSRAIYFTEYLNQIKVIPQ